MTHSVRVWAAAFAVAYAASLTTVFTQSPPQHAAATSLRVCGDPDNLPYSNDRLQGFENRIASVIASDLGVEPSYTWWPHQRGLVKNTLEAGTCDVIFGIPHDLETILPTKPYYTSSLRHRATQRQRARDHVARCAGAQDAPYRRLRQHAGRGKPRAARPGRPPDGLFPVFRSHRRSRSAGQAAGRPGRRHGRRGPALGSAGWVLREEAERADRNVGPARANRASRSPSASAWA